MVGADASATLGGAVVTQSKRTTWPPYPGQRLTLVQFVVRRRVLCVHSPSHFISYRKLQLYVGRLSSTDIIWRREYLENYVARRTLRWKNCRVIFRGFNPKFPWTDWQTPTMQQELNSGLDAIISQKEMGWNSIKPIPFRYNGMYANIDWRVWKWQEAGESSLRECYRICVRHCLIREVVRSVIIARTWQPLNVYRILRRLSCSGDVRVFLKLASFEVIV